MYNQQNFYQQNLNQTDLKSKLLTVLLWWFLVSGVFIVFMWEK